MRRGSLTSAESLMKEYDVIVIGGGPAGSTAAALAAAAGRRVLLLEKSHFPREKVCGEFISPECVSIFLRLGVLGRILEAEPRPIRRMDLIAPDGRRIAIPVSWFAGGQTTAFGLTRARLDAILLQHASDLGVEVRQGFRVGPALTLGRSWRQIEGRSEGGAREQLSGRLIVDASGRGPLFSPRSSRLRRKRLFACKVHLRGVEGLGDVGELYFFKHGYGGLSEIESDGKGVRTNLCFLTTEKVLRATKGDRSRLLALTVLTNPAARSRMKDAVFVDAWLGAGPIVYGHQPRVRGVIAIGDAGAFIDPFTGSGILLALSGGELAANLINAAFDGGEVESERIEERFLAHQRATFDWRFRACAMLRRLAYEPSARKLLVPILTRYESLTRLMALSTRQIPRNVVSEG